MKKLIVSTLFALSTALGVAGTAVANEGNVHLEKANVDIHNQSSRQKT